MSMAMGEQGKVDSCHLPVKVKLKTLEDANDGNITQGVMKAVGMTIGGRKRGCNQTQCMHVCSQIW